MFSPPVRKYLRILSDNTTEAIIHYFYNEESSGTVSDIKKHIIKFPETKIGKIEKYLEDLVFLGILEKKYETKEFYKYHITQRGKDIITYANEFIVFFPKG